MSSDVSLSSSMMFSQFLIHSSLVSNLFASLNRDSARETELNHEQGCICMLFFVDSILI